MTKAPTILDMQAIVDRAERMTASTETESQRRDRDYYKYAQRLARRGYAVSAYHLLTERFGVTA